jgi:putative acetyltransferase
MRTVPKALRRGVGRAILLAVIAEAQSRGYEKLCLETGRGALFDAAISLYVAEGFQPASEFAEYEASDFNQFFELKL